MFLMYMQKRFGKYNNYLVEIEAALFVKKQEDI